MTMQAMDGMWDDAVEDPPAGGAAVGGGTDDPGTPRVTPAGTTGGEEDEDHEDEELADEDPEDEELDEDLEDEEDLEEDPEDDDLEEELDEEPEDDEDPEDDPEEEDLDEDPDGGDPEAEPGDGDDVSDTSSTEDDGDGSDEYSSSDEDDPDDDAPEDEGLTGSADLPVGDGHSDRVGTGAQLADSAAPSAETDAAARADASGRDVTPPPGRQPAGQNPGLATEDDPERMDFREIDSGARWMGDRPAPDVLEREALPGAAEGRALPLGDDPGETAALDPASDDPIEAVTTAIEEAELLDIFDLSVERAGGVVILRGSAATPEERDRAGELAAALPGVERVQNLISAG